LQCWTSFLYECTNERYYELIGTRDNPLTSNWAFKDRDTGETKQVSVTTGEYRLNTVLFSDVYSMPNLNDKVGYIVFSSFIEPSVDELNAVIADFKEQNVTELVLDLRYNGGGRLRVGQRLAEQIAGTGLDGKLDDRSLHNLLGA